MALSPPSDYTTDIANPFTDNWLFQFHYGGTNLSLSSYYGLSFKDITVTDQNDNSKAYIGCISNIPSIRESINPIGGIVKKSNITVEVNEPSVFDTFYGGTAYHTADGYYLNQTVLIYSITNDTTDLDNGLLIYQGILYDMKHTDSKLTLSIKSKSVWDGIKIPNEFSTTNKVPVPVAYGNYTGNSTNTYYDASDTDDDSNSKFITDFTADNLRKIPLSRNYSRSHYFAVGDNGTTFTNTRPEYYDSNLDQFIPLNNDADNSNTGDSIVDDGTSATKLIALQNNGVQIRPTSEEHYSGSAGFDNPQLAYDTDSDGTASEGSAGDTSIWYFPETEGKFVRGKLFIRYSYDYEPSVGGDGDFFYALNEGDWVTVFENQTSDIAKTFLIVDLTSDLTSVTLDIHGNVSHELKAWDIFKRVEYSRKESPLKEIYTGSDGYVRSWDTGNLATTGLQIHRDILRRFVGITTTPTINGSSWATLDVDNASKSTCRVNITKPTDVGKILDRIAYECNFMFRLSPSSSYFSMQPNYISIKDSNSTDHTLNEDNINNLSVTTTPLSSLVTKKIINSDPHPATGNYRETVTVDNSSSRTNWEIGTNENIKQENLQYRLDNISGSGAGLYSFEEYTDNLNGDIKLRVSCNIVKPSIGAIVEVGDIVAFTNGSMTTKPFGTTWTSKQFVVVETNKSIGGQCAVKLWEI